MRWCFHLRDILVITILVMSNFDIDIGISNASFKVLALLVTCNSIWLGSKITFSLNYKWDSYALPRCSFIIHIPQKRDSFFATVLMDAGTLFHAVKSYLIHKHFLQYIHAIRTCFLATQQFSSIFIRATWGFRELYSLFRFASHKIKSERPCDNDISKKALS